MGRMGLERLRSVLPRLVVLSGVCFVWSHLFRTLSGVENASGVYAGRAK